MKQTIFIHIPKTAGTTLREIVYNQYDESYVAPLYSEKQYMSVEEFAKLPDDRKNASKAIIGHFPFGIHSVLPNKQTSYATFLRAPQKRLLSLYNHLRNHQFAGADVSLLEMLEQPIGTQFKNHQSRLISGVGASEISDDQLYKRTIENIEKHFTFIGLTERFDESLLLASKLLAWELLPYFSKNVATQWSADYTVEITENEELLSLLKNLNSVDQKVYEEVSKRFAEQLESFFPDLQASLEEYQAIKNNELSFNGVGNLGQLRKNVIFGWAKIVKSDLPAKVTILINGEHEFTINATQRRADLYMQHFTGRCGFKLTLPKDIVLQDGDIVDAKITNGLPIQLRNSPQTFKG